MLQSDCDLHVIGTGEHGVGLGKKEYLQEELGLNTVELMKSIKKVIDPLGIMNPGKVSVTPQCSFFTNSSKLYPEDEEVGK